MVVGERKRSSSASSLPYIRSCRREIMPTNSGRLTGSKASPGAAKASPPIGYDPGRGELREKIARAIFFRGGEQDDKFWRHTQSYLRDIALEQADAVLAIPE